MSESKQETLTHKTDVEEETDPFDEFMMSEESNEWLLLLASLLLK
ncbi:MAG: hypothetical protein NWE89_07030 [Candidatus Bathyarchaeota archaeon]|nr:hypothetical protein [Candidatus Bathyarchaeota archaeon]